MPSIEEVFDAGGQPKYTYVERDGSAIDRKLTLQLRSGKKLMTVVGPSKTGKTVLVRRIVANQKIVWVSGGEVRSEDDFWIRILHGVNAGQHETRVEAKQKETKGRFKLGAKIKIPSFAEWFGFSGAAGGEGISETKDRDTSIIVSEKMFHAQRDAVEHCQKEGRVIVIDDFHYIKKDVQTGILRSLKTPIFEGLKVIILAVPHRGFDIERAEGDFDGRVERFTIGDWRVEDLAQIATMGFQVLKIEVPTPLPKRLATEAQGNPLIMQSLCLMLCQSQSNEQIGATGREPTKLKIPRYDAFFSELAKQEGDSHRRLIVRANRLSTKGDQSLEREVLQALSECLPAKDIPVEDIHDALKKAGVIVERDVVVSNLVRLSTAAQGDENAPAPFEWDESVQVLHIISARFAYFVKWGSIPATGDEL